MVKDGGLERRGGNPDRKRALSCKQFAIGDHQCKIPAARNLLTAPGLDKINGVDAAVASRDSAALMDLSSPLKITELGSQMRLQKFGSGFDLLC